MGALHKRKEWAILCACALAACASLSEPHVPVTPPLIQAIDALNEAYRAADVDALDRLIAFDYAHTNGATPAIGRQQWLAWNRMRAERQASGAWRTDTYLVEDLQVRELDGCALVTGIIRSTGMRDGAPARVDVRFSAFWVLRDGVWQRAGFHDTPIPPPGGDDG